MNNMIANRNLRQGAIDIYPERSNLFQLTIDPLPTELYSISSEIQGKVREEVRFEPTEGSTATDVSIKRMNRAFQSSLLVALKEAKYQVSNRKIRVLKKDKNHAPERSSDSLEIYPSFECQVKCLNSNYYLCLDYRLLIRAPLSLANLANKFPAISYEPFQRVFYRVDGEWNEGRFISGDTNNTRLQEWTGDEIAIPPKDVFPDLHRGQIIQVASALNINQGELEKLTKKLSLLTAPNAPRARLDACTVFASELASRVFPIQAGEKVIELNPDPVVLRPPLFTLGKDLIEPEAAFDHIDQTKRSVNILTGLVKHGAYDKPSSQTHLALLTTPEMKSGMDRLVQRLNDGSVQYPGARKTFGGKFAVSKTIVCNNVEEYEEGIQEFCRSSESKETDVVLTYVPKSGDITSHLHPYYKTKATLLREGFASQMVDKSTLFNPDYRDLNLALNIFAKAGNTPWVLDRAIQNVDLFIGLSYSSKETQGRIHRTMSYVNIFDAYGRWKFYESDTKAFSFEDRLKHFKSLIKNSLAAYKVENGGELRRIHIHYTKKFSTEERRELSDAIRSEVPGASVTYVSINPHHHLRLFNLTEGSDGSVSRATYLLDEPGRIYLATTGKNIFGTKGMGTPVPLELTVWTDPKTELLPLSDVAQQVLSLTRLNWASSRSFCREPITTKFAGEIAHKMVAFMNDPAFSVNPLLRNKPWFL